MAERRASWTDGPHPAGTETYMRQVERIEALEAALRRFVFFEDAFKAKQYDVGSVAVAEVFDEARRVLEGTQ